MEIVLLMRELNARKSKASLVFVSMPNVSESSCQYSGLLYSNMAEALLNE
jgi:hypothetical protein